MRLPLLALVAAALSIPTAPALAQAPIDPVVRMQLDAATQEARSEGYVLQGSYLSGSLREGGDRSFTLHFRAGHEYMVIGVCDVDCDDLDLVLADDTGEMVDLDYELDDVPIVLTDVQRDGSYTVTVSMASCSIEPCGYGMAVFARRR
jgi:hypothetical protein